MCLKNVKLISISLVLTEICASKCIYIPGRKLDEINDDCLTHIFKFFDIYDLYNVSCSSSKFENVLPLFNRKFEFTITNVSTLNIKHFLEKIGMQIETLTITIGKRERSEVKKFFECVQKQCPNIKVLFIKNCSHLNFARFSNLLKRLKSLRLEECEYTKIYDVPYFMNIPWITQSMPMELQKSEDMSDLVILKLHSCKGFKPCAFKEFLKQQNRFIELSLFALEDFKNSDVDFFNELVPNLQNIEALSIDANTTSHIQFIANLPKLRSLQLLDYSIYNDRIVDRLLRRINDETNKIEELDLYHCYLGMNTYRVISQFQQLHTLKLRKHFWVTENHLSSLDLMPKLKTVCCFDNVVLTDLGIISLVRVSPMLTHLDCSWCYQV